MVKKGSNFYIKLNKFFTRIIQVRAYRSKDKTRVIFVQPIKIKQNHLRLIRIITNIYFLFTHCEPSPVTKKINYYGFDFKNRCIPTTTDFFYIT